MNNDDKYPLIHDKRLIIHAILGGTHIPTGGINEYLTPYCGNQHNPDWKWNETALWRMDIEPLEELYKKHRIL